VCHFSDKAFAACNNDGSGGGGGVGSGNKKTTVK
jgi:hypothetical protein